MFTFASLVVVGHLKASSSESALDVEAFVGVAAVEDALVAANLLGDVIEGLDQAEAELLALLVLGDSDVFDVADFAQAVDAVEQSRLAAGCLGCEVAEASGVRGYRVHAVPRGLFSLFRLTICARRSRRR